MTTQDQEEIASNATPAAASLLSLTLSARVMTDDPKTTEHFALKDEEPYVQTMYGHKYNHQRLGSYSSINTPGTCADLAPSHSACDLVLCQPAIKPQALQATSCKNLADQFFEKRHSDEATTTVSHCDSCNCLPLYWEAVAVADASTVPSCCCAQRSYSQMAS
eukprot:CAMPEP_0202857942 /NCGR_PEP_ID=MMETSP1391-20130828/683_1 /ASSEMBLY_ACC=CAM_ASM_000867 /TAXON_ID=1034604 /ORGANISM="Chlamydomonas leiostraca, Strain SAG 11-49" /LENGTH=162 /DNA_ID=CAMNT_0049536807 /DNA_START=203 /DNA_END=687 /DNA_ORIENTATION=+